MMTRRTVLGAGLAFTAVAGAAGLGAHDSTAHGRREARAVDALLIDETIEMPRQVSAIVQSGTRTTPVVAIQLDAASHAGLMRVLDSSQFIVGISSGATLFCLERMAWDQGLRLTERRQWCATDPGDDAGWRDVVALLGGTRPLAASPSHVVRAYRASRVDATLHAWVMQKPAGSRIDLGRLEA